MFLFNPSLLRRYSVRPIFLAGSHHTITAWEWALRLALRGAGDHPVTPRTRSARAWLAGSGIPLRPRGGGIQRTVSTGVVGAEAIRRACSCVLGWLS